VRLRLDDGGELEYTVSGSGPALLLLHAFPLGHFMWQAQADALAGAQRVIRFDARGFGASAAGAGPLTMERIADDAAALLDHLGVERAAVGGCSMGGYAALAFARLHPARLRALYLQDTRAGADAEQAKANRAALAARVLAEGSRAALEAFLPKLLGATTQREQPALVAQLAERILATAPRAIADALHGLTLRPDAGPSLTGVRVPTLVLVGAEDVLTPPAESEAIAAAIPGARLVVVPRAGHLANLEQPGAVNAALVDWLAWVNAGSVQVVKLK
jgi:pimeloyl-ACP methyl ester carboxylesterase